MISLFLYRYCWNSHIYLNNSKSSTTKPMNVMRADTQKIFNAGGGKSQQEVLTGYWCHFFQQEKSGSWWFCRFNQEGSPMVVTLFYTANSMCINSMEYNVESQNHQHLYTSCWNKAPPGSKFLLLKFCNISRVAALIPFHSLVMPQIYIAIIMEYHAKPTRKLWNWWPNSLKPKQCQICIFLCFVLALLL